MFLAVMGCTHAEKSGEQGNDTLEMDTAALDEAYRFQIDTNYKPEPPQQPAPDIENIPDFSILTTDKFTFTQANLKKNKPVMFIYFSPDCSHCTNFMHDLQPQFKQLSNMKVIMVSWIRIEALVPFYKEFGLKSYPNFIVGTEGSGMKLQGTSKLKKPLT